VRTGRAPLRFLGRFLLAIGTCGLLAGCSARRHKTSLGYLR